MHSNTSLICSCIAHFLSVVIYTGFLELMYFFKNTISSSLHLQSHPHTNFVEREIICNFCTWLSCHGKLWPNLFFSCLPAFHMHNKVSSLLSTFPLNYPFLNIMETRTTFITRKSDINMSLEVTFHPENILW